jgi:hypothetical protein
MGSSRRRRFRWRAAFIKFLQTRSLLILLQYKFVKRSMSLFFYRIMIIFHDVFWLTLLGGKFTRYREISSCIQVVCGVLNNDRIAAHLPGASE